MKIAAAILIILIMMFAPASGGTIYIWTDENGVKRFSDNPPEGIEEYETAVSSESKPSEGKREGLEKMLKEQEAQDVKNRAKEQEAKSTRKAEKQKKARTDQAARSQAERDRLEKKIDALRKRALSPTFTEGMRQHQIDEIQKQINALE